MKFENIVKILLMFVVAIVALLFIRKVERYLNADIAYSQLICGDSAYIIYKGYDDQADDVREHDLALRLQECLNVQTEFQKTSLFGE
ncbi:MAG: hypothetical protein WC730_00980 [Patescibacteria group bacterium]|jgi:hypothetical protein